MNPPRTPCREVVGLDRAEAVQGWPSAIPRMRASRRGSRGAGLRFERLFASAMKRALPDARHGPWYRFWDVNGVGLAQPDVVLVREDAVLVVECKLTDTEQARMQLRGLYFPVLGAVYARPVRGIVVVRHLTPRSRLDVVCDSLASALSRANGVIPTLHWLGHGAL